MSDMLEKVVMEHTEELRDVNNKLADQKMMIVGLAIVMIVLSPTTANVLSTAYHIIMLVLK